MLLINGKRSLSKVMIIEQGIQGYSRMLLNLRKILRLLQPLLLLASVALVIIGMLHSGNSLSSPWSSGTFKALCTWLAGASIGLVLIRIIQPRWSPLLALLSIIIFLFIGAGPVASLACLIFLAAIHTLGIITSNYILGSTNKNNRSWLQTYIFGLSIYIFIIGAMIHVPINYPLTYVLLILAPLAAALRTKKNRAQQLTTIKNTAIALNRLLSQISYWKLSATLILIGFVAIYTFIPSITSDDNSYHLAMWSQLHYHHEFLFDVKTQIWSAAPFTLDMIHSFISVIAMQDARGPLNVILFFFLLLTILDLSGHILKNTNQKLLTLVLFSSTPIVTNLLLGLQTELLLALLTTLGICITANEKFFFMQKALLIFLISCILVSIKLPALLLAASLTICLLISEWRKPSELNKLSRSDWLKIILVGAVGCAIALHAYVNAYLITGNPTFPLYNGIFKSSFYYPTNFKDDTYAKGANLTSYLGFFFDSSKYFESSNFIAGFQYLVLPIFGAIYLLSFGKSKAALYLIIPIAIYGGIMFSMMQYWRYLFPILPLASILAVVMFSSFENSIDKSYLRNLAIGVFSFYLLLNIRYLPGVSWILHNNPFDNFSAEGRLATARGYNDESVLNQYMNKHHQGKSVLFEMNRSSGATLWGKPFYLAWISPSTLHDFDEMKNTEDLINYLKLNDIHFVYQYQEPIAASFYFRDFIQEAIVKYGTKEASSGNINLYRLDY